MQLSLFHPCALWLGYFGSTPGSADLTTSTLVQAEQTAVTLAAAKKDCSGSWPPLPADAVQAICCPPCWRWAACLPFAAGDLAPFASDQPGAAGFAIVGPGPEVFCPVFQASSWLAGWHSRQHL